MICKLVLTKFKDGQIKKKKNYDCLYGFWKHVGGLSFVTFHDGHHRINEWLA
jgi:hypothetical protein